MAREARIVSPDPHSDAAIPAASRPLQRQACAGLGRATGTCLSRPAVSVWGKRFCRIGIAGIVRNGTESLAREIEQLTSTMVLSAGRRKTL